MEESKKLLKGIPVSEGWALAKAYHYEQETFKVREDCTADGEQETQLALFQDAFSKAKAELEQLYDSLAGQDEDKAKIFRAHMELLEDEEILEEIQMAIEDQNQYAESAINQVFDMFAEMLANVEDPLIAGRAADLLDVKRRLLRICMNKEIKSLSNLQEDVVVVAHDLSPSDTATMDRMHIKGIITEIGGYNSHSAILARSFCIPAVLGVSNALSEVPVGEKVMLNAVAGEVTIAPDMTDAMNFAKMQELMRVLKETREQYRTKECLLSDGRKIEIGINVGSTEFDAQDGLFDFVGLFRTEFLYMESNHLPSEEEQFVAYKTVVEKAGGRPVTLRTLDIGGDKTLPYMELPKEENPFLGKRALRLCLSEEELFLSQLRAALRASAFGPLQLMFPMVGSLEDIRKAKAFVEKAKLQLREANQAYDDKVAVGIMIEIPSIALIADLAAKEVDFASVGTNDLTQYLCAADRMNESVGAYYQTDCEAMYRLLRFVFEAFDKEGKPVSVCGEMAGKPESAVKLVEIGAKKLSMSAASIPAVKEALSTK